MEIVKQDNVKLFFKNSEILEITCHYDIYSTMRVTK